MQERPRERLIRFGVENISNEELLAILLKTGTKNTSAKEIAIDVLKEVETISNLSNIKKEHLTKIRGIGMTKAVELLAAIELGKRMYLMRENKLGIKYLSSKTIYEDNKYLFIDKKQELFYVLYLDSKNKLIERKLLFMGTLNRSIVHPREIFKNAYLYSAAGIVCLHNHPSGDLTPSNEDIFLTKHLIEIGRIQGIPVLDHIIISNLEYFSFHDNNLMICDEKDY
ncbi:MAG TPA: DNA repair protein RadC [Bacilli bacterium]|nr:DNA repair protein RadC [Bacilli bacterium]